MFFFFKKLIKILIFFKIIVIYYDKVFLYLFHLLQLWISIFLL